MRTFWDERYDRPEYVYGTEPNSFLVENVRHIPKGRVLCLAEGEGRNAVFLAQKGYDVTAIDASKVGLSKARDLAESENVKINTIQTDLVDWPIDEWQWQGIVSIFCHLPMEARHAVFQRCAAGLAPNGIFLMEAFSEKQLQYNTGGPPNRDLLIDLTSAKKELAGLSLLHAHDVVRDIREGIYHTGKAAVVQILAKKER